MSKTIQGIVIALLCAVGGAGTYHLVQTTPSAPIEKVAKIVGPTSIAFAGQYAEYHVDVPGKNPSSLIYTWSVEPVTPIDANSPVPTVRPTNKTGFSTLDTVAGKWRLTVAIADPSSKSGQVCSIEVCVPHEGTPAPSPNPSPKPDVQPKPDPAPSPGPAPGPAPQPTPTPTPDTNRFSEFTSNVRTWLSQVGSPDKEADVALMAAGAADVAAALRTGNMSKLSGLTLRVAVASAIMASNDKLKNPTNWAAFGKNVNAAATKALNAGQLNAPSDWAEFLDAFQKGLKA